MTIEDLKAKAQRATDLADRIEKLESARPQDFQLRHRNTNNPLVSFVVDFEIVQAGIEAKLAQYRAELLSILGGDPGTRGMSMTLDAPIWTDDELIALHELMCDAKRRDALPAVLWPKIAQLHEYLIAELPEDN